MSVRLIHGDCLNTVRSFADKSVDMIFTDPPYGHNNNNNGDLIHRWELACGRAQPRDGGSNPRPIANDGPEANDLFRAMLPEMKRVLKPGGCCCCCCGGGGPDPQFARWSLWMNEVLDFKQMVVWDKGPIGMGWHYRRSYETVLVAQRQGAACAWYDETNKVENIIRPGQHGARKIIPALGQHPTEKPWQLAAHFIQLHTRPGDVVLDPFMGHGSTGEAAVRFGRAFIGVEINPMHYCSAEKRIADAESQGNLFVPVQSAERRGRLPIVNLFDTEEAS